jgi:NADH-quinone oxidoreductase subunit L
MKMLAILALVPLLIAAFIALPMRRWSNDVKYVAFCASLVSLAIVLIAFTQGPAASQSYSWFSLGQYQFTISVAAGQVNLLLLLIVSIITPLIFLYSMGYMDVPSEQPRFYFEMCIFAASMMLFALSASFITLLIAWEMLGLASYLLIGFWYGNDNAPTAARKAITTIIIGDIAMLLAVVLIGIGYGSFEYSAVIGATAQPELYAAAVLLLIAAFTKSAQFPFHEWLSDAMEGPTPVSAFLHSSTMVKAGVFLIIILFPIYQMLGLQTTILAIGLISAFIGVSNALTSRHIKKILAYSTIEDLGLMFVALGLNAVGAAIALFFVQSFYKALLFMSAGSIMKANNEETDIFRVFNSSHNKILYATMLVSVLSIAGFVPFSGFFGKYAVGSAAYGNVFVYSLLVLIELGSSIYIFRWLFIPMRENKALWGKKSSSAYLPKTMLASACILAILVVAASAFFLFQNQLGLSIQSSGFNLVDAVVLNAVALAGLGVSYYIYARGHRMYLELKSGVISTLFGNNVITNKVYGYLCSFALLLSSAAAFIEEEIDDITYKLSDSVMGIGKLARPVINGQVNNYLIGVVIGLVVLAAIVFGVSYMV